MPAAATAQQHALQHKGHVGWCCCCIMHVVITRVTSSDFFNGMRQVFLIIHPVRVCRNYIACDMGSLFESAGFQCDTKYTSSATKTWSFRKPEADGVLAEVPAAADSLDAASTANMN